MVTKRSSSENPYTHVGDGDGVITSVNPLPSIVVSPTGEVGLQTPTVVLQGKEAADIFAVNTPLPINWEKRLEAATLRIPEMVSKLSATHPTYTTRELVELVETLFPPPSAATAKAVVVKTTTTGKPRSGWCFDANILPLASSEFPPTNTYKGVSRSSSNTIKDAAGYAVEATMRKHRGVFKTAGEWETLAKATYSILLVGSDGLGNMKTVLKHLRWLRDDKALQSGVTESPAGSGYFGIPSTQPQQ